jgi:hypothetical protein
MDQDKRRHRELKREIKRAGKRQVRRRLQRALADDPEGAADVEIDYGRNSSASLNGNDNDATRRRRDAGQE